MDGREVILPPYQGIDQYHRAIASLQRICSDRSLVEASTELGCNWRIFGRRRVLHGQPIIRNTPQKPSLLRVAMREIPAAPTVTRKSYPRIMVVEERLIQIIH